MKTKYIALMAGVAIVCFLSGCASQPVRVSTVGPEPTPGTLSSPANLYLPGDHGYLRVYSDTKTRQIGENTYYYTHVPYDIYNQSGSRVKWVHNHIGDMDEMPTRVTLPVGRYYVRADSTSYGRVTVPIIIQGGKETDLHLDHQWQPSADISSNAIVRLPDGEPVGWLAETQ
jgi:hypothetical protein